ncbi:MAG: hypothetical protein DBY43_01915 [Clostridiaceae bacterium]|nr:MAG: hypothetical protein DBY43_01915 [Clostridiaceae bacterium]
MRGQMSGIIALRQRHGVIFMSILTNFLHMGVLGTNTSVHPLKNRLPARIMSSAVQNRLCGRKGKQRRFSKAYYWERENTSK